MRAIGLGLIVILMSGCELLAGGGGGTGGGGGGGGGGMISFSRGYVFVRKDDRNVYLADEKDLQLTARLTTGGGARHPSISSDARRVVFARQTGSDTELATVATAGGSTTAVLSSSANVKNLRNPIFSKDLTQIFFAYDTGTTASAIGVVNADGTGFKSLVGGSSFSYASPSLFTDGLTMLAGAGNSSSALSQLERVDAASGSPTPITNALGLNSEGQQIINRVVVSPDGSKAAYDGRLTAGGTRIFVVNLGTKGVTRLTDYPADPHANDSSPTWVGNDRVGFSSDIGGNDQVYVLPASSTNTSGGLTLPSAIEPWYGP